MKGMLHFVYLGHKRFNVKKIVRFKIDPSELGWSRVAGNPAVVQLISSSACWYSPQDGSSPAIVAIRSAPFSEFFYFSPCFSPIHYSKLLGQCNHGHMSWHGFTCPHGSNLNSFTKVCCNYSLTDHVCTLQDDIGSFSTCAAATVINW